MKLILSYKNNIQLCIIQHILHPEKFMKIFSVQICEDIHTYPVLQPTQSNADHTHTPKI